MAGNAVFSYTRSGKKYAISAWCNAYTHSFDLIATESASRRQRAFYPHRVAVGQFALTLELKTRTNVDPVTGRPVPFSSEYEIFMNWLADYANYLMSFNKVETGSDYPAFMSVSLTGRNWARIGIPIAGYGFGDNVGSIVFRPTIVFECLADPYEPKNVATPSSFNDIIANAMDPQNVKYFYPLSEYANGTSDASVYEGELPPIEPPLTMKRDDQWRVDPSTDSPNTLPSIPPPTPSATTWGL